MAPEQLQPKHWYWIRRLDGSLAPYQFHRLCPTAERGGPSGEFFVGSLLQTWPLGRVIAEARMPRQAECQSDSKQRLTGT